MHGTLFGVDRSPAFTVKHVQKRISVTTSQEKNILDISRQMGVIVFICICLSMCLFIAPSTELDHNFHSFPAPMTGLALQQGNIITILFSAVKAWTDSHYLYQIAMSNSRFSQGSTEKEKPFSHLIMVWKQVYRVCIFIFCDVKLFAVVISFSQLMCHINTTLLVFLCQCEHIMAFDIYTTPSAKKCVQ